MNRDASFPAAREPGIPPAKKSAAAYAALSGSKWAAFTNKMGRKLSIAEIDRMRKIIVTINRRKYGFVGFFAAAMAGLPL